MAGEPGRGCGWRAGAWLLYGYRVTPVSKNRKLHLLMKINHKAFFLVVNVFSGILIISSQLMHMQKTLP